MPERAECISNSGRVSRYHHHQGYPAAYGFAMAGAEVVTVVATLMVCLIQEGNGVLNCVVVVGVGEGQKGVCCSLADKAKAC